MIPKKVILLLFISLFSISLFSNDDLIIEINIRGNKNIDAELIKSALSFEIGDIMNADDVSNSIKTLYNLNIFKDIYIEKSESSNGIALTINIEEFNIIEDFEIKGNKRLKDKKIEELLELRAGMYWADYLPIRFTQILKSEYSTKSYNFIKVDYTVKETKNNALILVITVDEGEKTRIKKINFHGNKTIKSRTIAKKMTTKKVGIFRFGKFDKEKFEQDLDAIIAFYNKKGYIDARIISQETKMIDEKNMIIDIWLHEGIQFHFGTVAVSGNTRFQDDLILKNFKFKEKEIFNLQKFDIQLNQVREMYYEEGYIYHQIEDDIIKTGDFVDIKLRITENTRAKVRKIYITGNLKTKEKVIRRHLEIHPGEYFRRSKIVKSQQNIYNMGLFEPDINLDYQNINQNGDVDLTMTVHDKSSGSANGGVGYNSDNKFVGQFSLSHNNILGNNWRSSIKTEFGGDYQKSSGRRMKSQGL